VQAQYARMGAMFFGQAPSTVALIERIDAEVARGAEGLTIS